MNKNLYRRFYTAYGYFQAMSEFNLHDSFIAFLNSVYDIFASMGKEYEFKIQSIIDEVWEDDTFSNLKDDVNTIEIVEEIENIFREANL